MRTSSSKKRRRLLLLLLLLVGLGHLAESFSVVHQTPRRGYCHSTSIPPRKSALDLSWKDVSNSIVAPIPPRQEDPQFLDHFRPSFVVEEFLLGFNYMVSMLLELAAVSVVCHHFRSRFLPPGCCRVLRFSNTHPVIRVDGVLKRRIYQWAPQPGLQLKILGPLIEEIVYRGVAHFVAAWTFGKAVERIRQTKHDSDASIGVLVFGLFLLPMLEPWDIRWVGLTSWSIRFGIFFRVALILMENGQDSNSPDGEDHGSGSTEDGEQSIAMDERIDRLQSLSTRLYGAILFGMAHIPVGGPIPVFLYLQKAFGTFVSSMLVESRLVVQRRNLWGAIGAHTAFNLFFGTFLNSALNISTRWWTSALFVGSYVAVFIWENKSTSSSLAE